MARKAKPRKGMRFNYAIESVVDRTVREQYRFLDHCLGKSIDLHSELHSLRTPICIAAERQLHST